MKNGMHRGHKQWIKDLLLDLSDRIDTTCLANGELIPPKKLSSQYGGGSHAEIGLAFFRHLLDFAKLSRTSHVLDVGCGAGRIALPLTAFLTAEGRYEGFDIMPEGIAHCSRVVTPRHPNFRFTRANVHNSFYNPEGSVRPEDYTFDYPDASFDIVISTSVFTHLRPNAIARYLGETGRVLRPGGMSLHTCFLMNAESLAAIAAGNDSYGFRHEIDDFRTSDRTYVEAAIAVHEADVVRMHEAAGLHLAAIHRGNWSAPGAARVSHQDICVGVRR